MPDLLTDAEAAQVLRVSPRTVARLRTSGQIPYLRGRPALIERADLLAYIERRKETWVRHGKTTPLGWPSTGPGIGKSGGPTGKTVRVGRDHALIHAARRIVASRKT